MSHAQSNTNTPQGNPEHADFPQVTATFPCYTAAQDHLAMRLGYTTRWVAPWDLCGKCNTRTDEMAAA